MKKRVLLITFFVVFSLPSLASAAGVLIDVAGRVDYTLPGKKSDLGKIGVVLPSGSIISVGEEGSAAIMFDNGDVDKILPGQSYTVGGKIKSNSTIALGNHVSMAMRELLNPSETLALPKEARGPFSNIPIKDTSFLGIGATFPINTSIRLEPKITFEWNDAQPVNWPQPVLVIDDAEKSHIVAKRISTGTREITIDTRLAGLKKGGAYSWYLASYAFGIKGKTLRFEFSIVSEEDEKKIDTMIAKIQSLEIGEDGKKLLLAQLYLGLGLNYNAAQILESIIEGSQTPFTKKLLWFSYSKMGRITDAEKYK